MDLLFDIGTRELVMKNGDFVTTNDPSPQNSGILLRSRCAVLLQPIAGVGIEQVINSNNTTMAYEMNRWKAMAIADGAVSAYWQATPNSAEPSETDFKFYARYE